MIAKPVVKQFIPSPHFSSRRGARIDRIVLHYTTSRNAMGSLTWWAMEKSKVSAHYLVGREGELYQAVKDADKAWHAENANPSSIGIEFAAAPGDRMTPAQEATGIHLIHWLVETYSIPWTHINGHRYSPGAVSPTDCPCNLFGDATEAAVLAWVAKVRASTAPAGRA